MTSYLSRRVAYLHRI